jgi:hypothetical protein
MTVRKAMDPQQHDTTTNDARLFGTDKRLPKRWTRSFRHHRPAYLTLPCSIVGFDVGAALPPNDRHGDETTADGRRFMLTTSKKELHCVPNRYVFKSRFSTT